MRHFIMLSAAAVFALSTLFAQAPEWKLDKAHSKVTFAIGHMVISEVTGYFKDFAVQVNAPDDDFTNATIASTIKVASIDTDNERRDGHLKSDDFFNAEKFPEITFKSTSVKKIGENSYKIHGNLTIRDVTKSVTFDAVHRGTIKTSQGTVSAWKATLSLNRFDYNLKWNRTIETGGLVAGETVTITLNLELQKPTP